MKHLYTLLFSIISFSLYSQETIITQWDFTSDTTLSTGNYSGSGTTDMAQILDYSTLTAPTSGYVKLDVPNSAKYSNLFCSGIGLNSGILNFSMTLDGWNIVAGSGSHIQIRFRDSDNKIVATVKLDENKASGSFDGKSRVVGNMWSPTSGNNGTNGAQKSAGHFGPTSLEITDTHTLGLTIDFDNNTYSFWTETPNSPTYSSGTREFVYDFGAISGSTPSDMSTGAASVDHVQVSYKASAGEYFNLSQIKLSSGSYVNTASSKIDLKSNLHIYPNPAGSYFIAENAVINDNLKIFNVGGKLMKTQTMKSSNEKINIEELNKGIYFVKIDDREAVRLIKK